MTSITLPRSKSSSGIAYHVTGNPEGLPVVLIHGVGLRAESWYQQIAALATDYAVYAVDMPGHGDSKRLTMTQPTLSDFTAPIAALLATVINRPAVIIGHSMGALLALNLASNYPEWCAGIVPMNAVYQRNATAQAAVQQRAASLRGNEPTDPTAPIQRWFSDPSTSQDAYHADLCAQWLLAADRAGYAAAYTVFAEEDGLATTALQALKLPCLFMTGALDPNSTSAMTEAMAATVPGARSTVIADSRHMTPLTHAFAVNRALSEFLSGIDNGTMENKTA